MSLVGTLGRMAIGIVAAKGVSKMMSGRSGSSGSPGTGGSGVAGMLGGLLGGQSSTGSPSGGLGNLGSLLGGGSGGSSDPSRGGALTGGGLGGLLEKFGGAASGGTTTGSSPEPGNGSLGHLLNRSLQGDAEPQPDPEQEALARVLIQAMINAAKSDGTIDEQERARIVEHMGEGTTVEEREFVLSEMRKPLDLDGFLATVPRGAERQVYTMSLMAIELDERAEAQYLDGLRKGMNLSEQDADAIHKELGVPTLYS